MGSAQASDALENKMVDHLCRSASWTKPTQLNVALFTAAPSDAGGGTEVSSGGYARVNLPPSDTNWTATQGGMSSNAVAITFPAPTADWGMVGWFGLFDQAGTLQVWDALLAPRTILSGDPAPSFQPGSLQITIA